ncbi:MAG: class I SAM-dependent methyltransferase [Bacteroidales bacterium]|nr:class I SAM-dependent methyltransferase [Bacteroidales bacterium]
MIFSKNPIIRHQQIFNLIAPFYSALDKQVKKGFGKAIKQVLEEVDLKNKSVLDLGTGPGAWAALFKKYGAEKVHGIDFAEKMIHRAQKRYAPQITFSVDDATNLVKFEDNSFDIVTASFMLHGFGRDYREKILKEMKRIARELIIVNDYYGKTPLIAQILEYFEKSDYKNFKETFCDELKIFFPLVKRKKASWGTSVYFAYKK